MTTLTEFKSEFCYFVSMRSISARRLLEKGKGDRVTEIILLPEENTEKNNCHVDATFIIRYIIDPIRSTVRYPSMSVRDVEKQ